MKKLVYLFVLVALVSCKSKDTWNKESLLEKCKTEMGKDENVKGQLTAEQQAEVCECSVDKLLAKYKTKAEADKNKAEVDAMGMECASTVLMPKDNMDPAADTITPADSTGQADSTDQQ